MTAPIPDRDGLGAYWRLVRARWVWVLLPPVIVTSAVAAYSARQVPTYEATTRVLVSDTVLQRSLGFSSPGSGDLMGDASLAESDAVEELVGSALGVTPHVTVTTSRQSDILAFTATSTDAADAALYADTWAEKYVEVKRAEAVENIEGVRSRLRARLEEIRDERQSLRAPLDELDERIAAADDPDEEERLQRQHDRLADDLRYELALLDEQGAAAVQSLAVLELQAELSAVGEARIVQTAVPTLSSDTVAPWRVVAYGIAVGLVTGLGLAVLAETRDTRIKSALDVQMLTDVPVLSSIPRADTRDLAELPFVAHREATGPFADAFHLIRSALDFVSLENDVKTVLITSANRGEGRTTTATNLACSLASVGKPTVLLDLDIRRPSSPRLFGIPQVPGLSDVVLHGLRPESVAHPVSEPGLEDLFVLAPGSIPPNPAAFVGTAGFLSALSLIRSQAGVVVLDAPPLTAAADAHTLARHCDAVILTVMAGRTTRAELTGALSIRDRVGANVIGIVVVGATDLETSGRVGRDRSPRRPVRDGLSVPTLHNPASGSEMDLDRPEDRLVSHV